VQGLAKIIEQLGPLLGELEAEPAALDGGITNRNYRVRLGGADYVIRLPGKDTDLLEIDRRAECEATELAASLGIAPAVAAMLDHPQCLVTAFLPCQTMAAEDLCVPEAIAEVARLLRAYHDSGATLPSAFSPFRIVETYAETAAANGVDAPPAYAGALAQAREIEAGLAGPAHEPVPCHNDLLAANFLSGEDRTWIVDWEYAGMGDRWFDLANFAVNNALGDAETDALLEAYFGEPPTAAAREALAQMSFMSDFREAMWGVVQSAVSDLDFDFTGYANRHFERARGAAG
jgi:thiamine kinase-like enzyme